MDVVYRRCAGLDVHKQSISACVMISGPGEEPARVEKRTFGNLHLGVGGIAELAEGVRRHPCRDGVHGRVLASRVGTLGGDVRSDAGQSPAFSRRAGSKDGSKRLRMARSPSEKHFQGLKSGQN